MSSSSEFGSTFQCRIDDGEWQPCPSDPWTPWRFGPPRARGATRSSPRRSTGLGITIPEPALVTFRLDPVLEPCANRYYGTAGEEHDRRLCRRRLDLHRGR